MPARRITRRIAIKPEFRDIDMMGVAHNCVYFEWFERGRLAVMNEVLTPDNAVKFGIAVPVVKNTCEYYLPVRLSDKLELITRHKIEDRFTGKLEFTHELRNLKTGALHAFGECVCSIVDLHSLKLLRDFSPEIQTIYQQLK